MPNDSRAKRPVYRSKEEAISTYEKVPTPNTQYHSAPFSRYALRVNRFQRLLVLWDR